MALASGDRLGAYEIIGLLGSGGMGEVYRARDTRLKRDVAIKVLPDAFAQDHARVTRFQREAELLATLNHPNIGAVYGLEQSPSTGSGQPPTAIVLELVEGDTLADRIARGPLPLDEALHIAKQIAEALEAAHERGVIHRDLKPANIKITPDGKLKVLDFGLAKALDQNPASATAGGLSNSPTLSMMATQAGVVLGTAAYMSPEQAKGFPADQRSDIFAFGTLLYEILVGHPPFQGDTAPDILASVLVREPDLTALPPNLNPRLAELLQRCLEKHPKKRWQAIGDVRAEIDRIAAAPRSAAAMAIVSQRPVWKRSLVVAATFVIGAAAAGAVVWKLRSPDARPVSKFAFMLGEGQAFTGAGRQVVAMSPDGKFVAYVANQQIFLRPLSEIDAKPIPGTRNTAGVLNPVFSPDSGSLAFFSDGSLKRIAISGGAAVTICPVDAPYGMSWPDDTILIGQGPKGIMRIPASGGKLETIAKPGPDELLHGPQLLPDGQTILFTAEKSTAANPWGTPQIVAQSLKTGERKILVEGGSDARYVPTGHLTYALGTVLLAIPFDLHHLAVTGGPTSIIEGVQRAGAGSATGTAQFSFSNTGTLSYLPARLRDIKGKLVYRSADGRQIQPMTGDVLEYPRYLRISPNGQRLAVTVGSNQGDIWIYDLQGGSQPLKVTFTEGNDSFPVWSRDGSRIAYHSVGVGGGQLWSVAADGSQSAPKRLPLLESLGTGLMTPLEFSPDDFLMFSAKGVRGSTDVFVAAVEGSNTTPRPLLHTEFNEGEARFSPDGHMVAYTSDSTGQFEVWIQTYPDGGAPVRVSRDGGHEPVWSPNGRRLFFQSGPRMMEADIAGTRQDIRTSTPQELFAGGFLQWQSAAPRTYDVQRDGRLLMVETTVQKEVRPEIIVVLNWFEELKQRVPVK